MFYLSRKGINLLTGFALQPGISENPFFESQIDTYLHFAFVLEVSKPEVEKQRIKKAVSEP